MSAEASLIPQVWRTNEKCILVFIISINVCVVTKCITIYRLCHLDGLVQERCNSIANALELRLSCTNPLIWGKQPLSLASTHTKAILGQYFSSHLEGLVTVMSSNICFNSSCLKFPRLTNTLPWKVKEIFLPNGSCFTYDEAWHKHMLRNLCHWTKSHTKITMQISNMAIFKGLTRLYRWLSARLQQLHCWRTGVIAVVH